jgi:hypothetical protein
VTTTVTSFKLERWLVDDEQHDQLVGAAGSERKYIPVTSDTSFAHLRWRLAAQFPRSQQAAGLVFRSSEGV